MPLNAFSVLLFLILVVYNFVNFSISSMLYDKFYLKAYGLSRKSRIWVINYVEKKVCEAQILSLSKVSVSKSDSDITDFNKMTFRCKTTGNATIQLCGADIFFTEESAIDYLNYIKGVNSDVLEYYPIFKRDCIFLKYINYFRTTQFGENPYSSISFCDEYFSSLFLFADVNINGNAYKPVRPLENLLRDYLHGVTKKEQFIDQMNEYWRMIN